MEINDWKNTINDFYKQKFPDQDWSVQDRLLGLFSQCSALGEKVQFNQGLRKIDKQHDSEEILVMAILLDVFVLCAKLNIDINKGLEKILLSFKKTKR